MSKENRILTIKRKSNPFDALLRLRSHWNWCIEKAIDCAFDIQRDRPAAHSKAAQKHDVFDDIYWDSCSMSFFHILLHHVDENELHFLPAMMLVRGINTAHNHGEGITPGCMVDLHGYKFGNKMDLESDMHCGDRVKYEDLVRTGFCFDERMYAAPITFHGKIGNIAQWKVFSTLEDSFELNLWDEAGDEGGIYLDSPEELHAATAAIYASLCFKFAQTYKQLFKI